MHDAFGEASQFTGTCVNSVDVRHREIDVIGVGLSCASLWGEQSENDRTTVEVVPSAPNRAALNAKERRVELGGLLYIRYLDSKSEDLGNVLHNASDAA
jgi:hypothetical protein